MFNNGLLNPNNFFCRITHCDILNLIGDVCSGTLLRTLSTYCFLNENEYVSRNRISIIITKLEIGVNKAIYSQLFIAINMYHILSLSLVLKDTFDNISVLLAKIC